MGFRRRPDLGFARGSGSGLSSVAARVRMKNSQQLEMDSLEHHCVVIKEFRERHAVHFLSRLLEVVDLAVARPCDVGDGPAL